jgi:hypothetical protein
MTTNFFSHLSFDAVFGSGIRDPRSGIRDPGSEIRDPGSEIRDPGSEIRDPGSGINIPDPQHCIAHRKCLLRKSFSYTSDSFAWLVYTEVHTCRNAEKSASHIENVF